jgi:hypothetical protein
MSPFTGTSTIRKKGFQFVASGIDLTLSPPPKLCAGGAKGDLTIFTLSSPPKHLRRWSEGWGIGAEPQ